MTILIVARHGNTFEHGETPRRVGARTDVPLTVKGREHGRNLGTYLKKINLLPNVIYTSHLKRTVQTAAEIINAAGLTVTPQESDIFNELDYGPDENLPEESVLARIGESALTAWEERGILPPGWSPDAETLMARWASFSEKITKDRPGDIVLVVTSNGIARFALGLTGDFDAARKHFGLKLATGAFGILEHDGENWTVQNWNVRP
ncbi:MAG: histidine phosphatase family protein [Micavibrio sp.]